MVAGYRLRARTTSPPSVAPALALREGDRQRLAELARLPSMSSGLAKRARIVLLAADGMPNARIEGTAVASRPTVTGWRDRYAAGGIGALKDEPRSGRPALIDEVDVVVATLADDGRPPARLGITYWSARFLGAEPGISSASVARIWRKWGIQLHRTETFKFSTHPELEAKVRDVVGLYLDPPANAVVVSVDEKPRIIRPWTAPRRCCRCGPACPPARPTTTRATAPPRCSPPWGWLLYALSGPHNAPARLTAGIDPEDRKSKSDGD